MFENSTARGMSSMSKGIKAKSRFKEGMQHYLRMSGKMGSVLQDNSGTWYLPHEPVNVTSFDL